MSDLVINVRQIGNYPALGSSNGTEVVLVQQGGIGGAYAAIETADLVATALANGGALGVGFIPPADANGTVFAYATAHPFDNGPMWNGYLDGGFRTWQSGVAAQLVFGVGGDFHIRLFPSGAPGSPLGPFSDLLVISPAGAATLPSGTLTVARDPAQALEVATMGWVGRSTVASFNGRRGVVTLDTCDIYQALGLCSPIATQEWVTEAIKGGIDNLLSTMPFVHCWNGRHGSVFLTLSDITCVFFQSGQQPISPNPAADSNDNSIATTAWVNTYITGIVEGEIDSKGLATEAWVTANTVASFNGRRGVVTLTEADITDAGGAPIISPGFYGIPTGPTANPGTSTAQLATTAFVQAAIVSATTGVVSFNGRDGVVELETQDIYDVGGALQASPAFTGTPTAPTAPIGTSTTQLATTAFVLNEVAAVTAGVASFNGRTGAVTLSLADITGVGGAPIASPAFSGTPTAPTPINPVDATTAIANTNWVVGYVTLEMQQTVASFNGRTGPVTLNANDVSAAGALVNPSPAMTGQPTAPTATPGSATTQLATTAFVQQAISGLDFVTNAALTAALANYVPLSGGVTITGPLTMGSAATLTLNANAAANLQAVPLQQMTSTLTSYATTAAMNAALANYVPLSGGVTITGPLDMSGQLTVASDIALTSGGGLYLSGSTFGLVDDGTTRFLLWNTLTWCDTWSQGTGQRTWAGTVGTQMALDASGNLLIAGTLSQGSDARTKKNISESPYGLNEIMQLRPVRFQRIPPPGGADATTPVELGFIAQDVQTVLPEAIAQIPVLNEGDEPMLGIQFPGITAALVNGVKTLAGEVAALKEEVSALKAAPIPT